MSRLRIAVVAAALSIPAILTAAVVLPHTFSNGAVADANAINQNFAVLRDGTNFVDARVEALEATTGSMPIGTLASPPFACGPANRGRLFLDTTTTTFYGCAGTHFLTLGGGDGSAKERARPSCRSLHDAMPSAPSGAYWIDPNGGSTDDAFQVYCDMSTGIAGAWTMVAKFSAGLAGDPTALWSGGALNEANTALLDVGSDATHYVNRIVAQHWNANGFTISEALVGVYTGGTLRASARFNVSGTNSTAWYAAANVASSTWTDLTPAAAYNFFGITGDAANSRKWFISNVYNGCPGDMGWLVLQTAATPVCPWENRGSVLRIIYANATSKQNWTSGSVANADALAVFVR